MPKLIRKSGILPWSIDNINNTPVTRGVYVLRETTSVDGIIYIGSSEDLEKRLKELFLSKDIDGVLYFDWYETEGISEAKELEQVWISKFRPKYNAI